jgi:hypothetical protein
MDSGRPAPVKTPARLRGLDEALKQIHGRYACHWNVAHQSSGHVAMTILFLPSRPDALLGSIALHRAESVARFMRQRFMRQIYASDLCVRRNRYFSSNVSRTYQSRLTNKPVPHLPGTVPGIPAPLRDLLCNIALGPSRSAEVSSGDMPIVHNDWGLEVPPDNAKLWRYLDLSCFISLISQCTLHFSLVKDFEDSWEGTLPAALKLDAAGMGGEMQKFYNFVGASTTRSIANYRVNCWHRNDVESVAMWKLYTRGMDGVAIETTVGDLKASLQGEESSIVIGQVKYVDHANQAAFGENPPPGVAAIFVKRRSFEHENEVRLAVDDEPFVDSELDYVKGPLSGGNVMVDTNALIRRIVASPGYPQWALPSLQAIVSGAGLQVTVETSDLLKPPEQ